MSTAETGKLKTDHRNLRSRLVVTGVDNDGRSTFVSDGVAQDRFVGDAFTTNMVWQTPSLPTTVTTSGKIGEITFEPPPGGFTYAISSFPPDSSYDYKSGYKNSLNAWVADHAPEPGEDPAMHTTNSVDIVTVISGEIWAVLETGEKLLKAGDTLIQRGTKHAWQNRSNTDCIISAVLVSITR